MPTATPLVSKVKKIIEETRDCDTRDTFTPQVIEAMRLADIYEFVKPQEYVLQLNLMAGLPSGTNRS